MDSLPTILAALGGLALQLLELRVALRRLSVRQDNDRKRIVDLEAAARLPRFAV